MNKVILFGGTGNLGKKIAEELKYVGYETTAIVRNEAKAAKLKNAVNSYVIADVTNRISLHGICNGFDIVISSLGKSVSPNDKSKPSFTNIDLNANSDILNEAVKSGVKKFVYISAFHAENYQHLEYFNVHHQFSEKVIQ